MEIVMRNRLKFVFCSLFALSLSGCTGIGGDKVKANYTRVVKHHIDMNWQAAYRSLKDQTIGCFQGGGGLSGTVMVDAQLYSELGEAEIQVNNGHLGTYLFIEVFKDGEGAKVIGYSALRTWNRNLDKLTPIIVNGKEKFDFDC
jgi:hypothetical protein